MAGGQIRGGFRRMGMGWDGFGKSVLRVKTEQLAAEDGIGMQRLRNPFGVNWLRGALPRVAAAPQPVSLPTSISCRDMRK
jgi:hypothetical protein